MCFWNILILLLFILCLADLSKKTTVQLCGLLTIDTLGKLKVHENYFSKEPAQVSRGLNFLDSWDVNFLKPFNLGWWSFYS